MELLHKLKKIIFEDIEISFGDPVSDEVILEISCLKIL
jgi:hypothetical protein